MKSTCCDTDVVCTTCRDKLESSDLRVPAEELIESMSMKDLAHKLAYDKPDLAKELYEELEYYWDIGRIL